MKDIELLDSAKKLYNILVDVSTGTNYNDPILISDFADARKILIKQKSIYNLIPDFVKDHRD